MKFTMFQDVNGISLRAEPTNLDGFPLISTLNIEWPCGEISGDRLAVASVLGFSPYMSGPQLMPDQISSLTSQLMERLLHPQWVHFEPVHPANLPLPRGRRWVRLSVAETPPESGESTVLLANPTTFNSWVAAPEVTHIATNAGQIDMLSSSATQPRSRASLAAAVLVAESMDVAGYIVSQQTAEAIGLNSIVFELLNAISLGVQVSDD